MKSHVLDYFELFFEIKGLDQSDRQAYFDTENAWEEIHGEGKYSSYQSFHVMKRRYLVFLRKNYKTVEKRRAKSARIKQKFTY